MFDLNQAIAEWRRQMVAAGIQSFNALDELEGHLREDIRMLASGGTPEDQAFQLAVARLGDHDSVSAEFKKLGRGLSVPVVMSVLLWTGATALAIFLLRGLFAGRLSFLLFSHIFSLTAGYGAALLTGALGIYWVSCQWTWTISSGRQRELEHTVRLFTYLAAALTVTGFALGGLWSVQHLEPHWVSRPRAMGGLCAALWLVTLSLAQRFRRWGTRTTMLLCILSNVIIGLAWFGPQFMAGITGCWPLYIFLGVHLLFLGLGSVPVFEKAGV